MFQLTQKPADSVRLVNNLIRIVIVAIFCIAFLFFIWYIAVSLPDDVNLTASNGYLDLSDTSLDQTNQVAAILGEWEFYPNQLYTHQDFQTGNIESGSVVTFPHYWKEDDDMDVSGYATYRLTVAFPDDLSEIGLYIRYQFSAYDVYIDDSLICSTGQVDKSFENYSPSYYSNSGYSYNLKTESDQDHIFDLIIHVQNDTHISSGLTRYVYISSANVIKNLHSMLFFINGLISGGFLLLLIYFIFVYLHDRKRYEYFDYTLVTLILLYISLTTAGESFLYRITPDQAIFNPVFLMRLEYIALITGSFFANYQIIKNYLSSKRVIFISLHLLVLGLDILFIFLNPITMSRLNSFNALLASSLFLVPLIINLIDTFKNKSFNTLLPIISIISIFSGIAFHAADAFPYKSIDLFSLFLMIHCILQMIIFIQHYGKIEKDLMELTETLDDRIKLRTAELVEVKERAEAATMAKSNFLATMSHEIRTPMNAIIGLSDLMRVDNLDELQLRYFNDIRKASNTLLQIINDILDFSKLEAGKLSIIPTHFNLFALYDNICSMTQLSAASADLAYQKHFDQNLPEFIYADEIRYKQVLLNIINNAIKYTREGYVAFSLEKTTKDEKDFILATVEDSGIGIKKENYHRVFDTFEQLDSNSNRKIVGTGLGLSITKNLLSIMGGDITFESEHGKGTTFYIYLPLMEGDPSLVEQPDAFIPIKVRTTAKVLVVDDNAINLTVALGFLATHNIHADTALSGEEAIRMIPDGNYDIVFMDHMMPIMDGVETTRLLRSMDNIHCRTVPIIALSANAVSGAKELFLSSGMNDFISKPINAAQLNYVLTKWLSPDLILSQQAQTDASYDLQDELIEIGIIGGIQVDIGLQHMGGSRTTYVTVLAQLCRETDSYTQQMKESLQTQDWKAYATATHTMKAVYANVGVKALSEWAARLESAARSATFNICHEETDALCSEMIHLKDTLMSTHLMQKVFSSHHEHTEASTADELIALLNKLKKACGLGMSEDAEDIAKKLEVLHINQEVDDKLSTICDNVTSFEYLAVLEEIKEVVAILKNLS